MERNTNSRRSSLHSHKKVADQDEKSVDAIFDKQAHRKLKNRHIQMIGIGGTIGTALFVQIGGTLVKGGPANLFLAFTIWCTFILAVSNCLAEMVSWMPISSPFVRYADHFVDPALGFCAGINFFVFEAALIPFEIVAFNVVLQFWTDKIPLAAVITFVIVTFAFFNLFAVKFYGESEFWLALGKALLSGRGRCGVTAEPADWLGSRSRDAITLPGRDGTVARVAVVWLQNKANGHVNMRRRRVGLCRRVSPSHHLRSRSMALPLPNRSSAPSPVFH
ncbi:hypothetical protein Agabi119p4_3376 [Agaricus bisporus var. burnettii]|uniref:Amino acid permease/ SLC12A domain-containing protein n=1 Tax=Agaricus bisporus var. burnettii TaxID=192524 RepID=A0A8H7KJC2_AGABI|nr:hypothetical protein Agabi119p4_3376 [Agaricus bisporus var. burnettii]